MPYFMRKEKNKYCVFKGTSNDPGELVKCYDTPGEASARLRELKAKVSDVGSGHKKSITTPVATPDWESMTADEIMAAKGKVIDSMGEPRQPPASPPFVDPVTIDEQDKKVEESTTVIPDDQFIVYKSGDTYRWLAISNIAIQDRELETITDAAYDDAIAIGKSLGYGELDLVHVDSTDVGDCDLMLRLGDGPEARLVEGGPWYNDPRATKARQAVQLDPSYWGVSIKFVYDPKQFIDGVYQGGIRIKKRTILPRSMAASYGTAIAVLGGEQTMKELDQETKDALSKLGIDESKIEELAERSKSLPDEVNTKTKDESPSIIDEIAAFIVRALGKNKETPEQTTPDVVEDTEVADPGNTQEKVEKTEVEKVEAVVVVVEPTPDPVESTIASETVKVIAETVAQSLAPSIQQAMQPLVETMTSIKSWQESIEKRLLEAEKDIETKVIEKLELQPPVVKVQTTMLKQAETDAPITTLLDSPASNTSAEFVKAVTDIVARGLNSQLNMPEFKLSGQD